MPITELLPLIFRLKGKPFSLDEFFPQEPLYRLLGPQPRFQVMKAGRQVAKSTGLAVRGIMRAATIPYFNLLTVTPLFEQVRKFSNNYVRPFIVDSSVRTLLRQSGADNSVLQRTLPNGSNMFYNYASNSADRIRGTPADECDLDECQDFDTEVLPVITSCMGASIWKFLRMSGTPKTFDGPLELAWQDSSQAIWTIPCSHCYQENGAATDAHLLKMVDHKTTLVCAHCARPLDSRRGYYVHRLPERQLTAPGYHMPQVIFPMHYAKPANWHEVQVLIRTKPKYLVYNECYGESYDAGTKLLTIEELKRACVLPFTPPERFDRKKYIHSALGVDWGGKGKEKPSDKDDFVSNTALALGGLRADGVLEFPWMMKTPYAADHYMEAALVLDAAKKAEVDHIAHDFSGAGNVREEIVLKKGWPYRRVLPFTYAIMSVNKPIVFYSPSGTTGARSSFTLDKTRSILLLTMLIKTRRVLFPEWEHSKDCIMDFLNLFEESMDGPRNSQRTLVKRMSRKTDDVVHAVNLPAMGMFYVTRTWPDIAEAFQTLEGDPEVWTAADLN